MKKYRVTIIEQYRSEVTIEADSEQEATEKGFDRFCDSRTEDWPDKEQPFERPCGTTITATPAA